MIRVLHYGVSANIGGIETYLRNLTQTRDRARYHFDFLYSDTGRPPALADKLESLGSSFYGVTPRRVSIARNRRELRGLVTPQRFDILHFHANTASYVEPVRAALRSGVKVIVHSHNAGASRSPVTQILHRANRRTLPWHEITKIAVSEEAAGWMFGRANDVDVVPNGILVEEFAFDASERDLKREELEISADTFVLGHVGAFLPAKNHPFILEVFSEVVLRRPHSVLLLVGTGPLENDLRTRVEEIGLETNVRFLGSRSDIGGLLAAMDCLVFPSRFEGFGLVPLEAQASGLRCVASEAVPSSVLIPPWGQQLALKAGRREWATAVLSETSTHDRTTAATIVRKAGFTVTDNTGHIEAHYERVSHR